MVFRVWLDIAYSLWNLGMSTDIILSGCGFAYICPISKIATWLAWLDGGEWWGELQWRRARWRLTSPASRLFIQPFIQAQIKEIIKAPLHWPLWGEFTGDRNPYLYNQRTLSGGRFVCIQCVVIPIKTGAMISLLSIINNTYDLFHEISPVFGQMHL